MTVVMSIKPVLNLVSRHQAMNLNYNPLHIVNTYGAFGSMTRERYEIVIEGTEDAEPTGAATWREYEFKGKPGDPGRTPPQATPYHLRLDWLMWFLPFSVRRRAARGLIAPLGYDAWFIRFMEKLLEGDRATLRLLRGDPFSGRRPRYVRARYYRYEYTSW